MHAADAAETERRRTNAAWLNSPQYQQQERDAQLLRDRQEEALKGFEGVIGDRVAICESHLQDFNNPQFVDSLPSERKAGLREEASFYQWLIQRFNKLAADKTMNHKNKESLFGSLKGDYSALLLLGEQINEPTRNGIFNQLRADAKYFDSIYETTAKIQTTEEEGMRAADATPAYTHDLQIRVQKILDENKGEPGILAALSLIEEDRIKPTPDIPARFKQRPCDDLVFSLREHLPPTTRKRRWEETIDGKYLDGKMDDIARKYPPGRERIEAAIAFSVSEWDVTTVEADFYAKQAFLGNLIYQLRERLKKYADQSSQ